MAGSSLPDAYALAAEQKREQEEYRRLRHEVRDGLDSIAGVCAQLKSGIDTPTTFLDRADFMRQVRSDVEEILEQANRLKETF